MNPATLSIALDPDQKAALDEVAASRHCSTDELIGEAVEEIIRLHRWQIAHIREGLRQAESCELASDDEVAAAFERFGA